MAELNEWDKPKLIDVRIPGSPLSPLSAQELIQREIAVANLTEDVTAWSSKWQSLKEDGQARC